MPTGNDQHDLEFDDLLALTGSERTWVDEQYAAPVDQELLIRFYHQQLSELSAEYVLDQITGFKSWRDAFLEVVEGQSRITSWPHAPEDDR